PVWIHQCSRPGPANVFDLEPRAPLGALAGSKVLLGGIILRAEVPPCLLERTSGCVAVTPAIVGGHVAEELADGPRLCWVEHPETLLRPCRQTLLVLGDQEGVDREVNHDRVARQEVREGPRHVCRDVEAPANRIEVRQRPLTLLDGAIRNLLPR